MSTVCFGSCPSHPPHTTSTFFFGAWPCAISAGIADTSAAASSAIITADRSPPAGLVMVETLTSLLKFAEPDIAVPHGVAVILERDRQPVRVRLVRRARLVRGGTGQLLVVLHKDAVVEHGHPRRRQHRAARIEARRAEHDVVGLPFARLAARVDEGGVLAVDSRRHAV